MMPGARRSRDAGRGIGRIAPIVILLVLLVALGLLAIRTPSPRATTTGGPAAAGGNGSSALPRSAPNDRDGRAALLVVPVVGVDRAAINDDWGDPRSNGQRRHHGTDLVAPAGATVIAAAPGVVEKLWQSVQGGTTVYVRSPARRWTYYYAHLRAYAAGLHEGQTLRAGDPVGSVGDTGDAGAGNFHLHFGLTRTVPAQHWYQGVDVDPFPYLTGRTGARRLAGVESGS